MKSFAVLGLTLFTLITIPQAFSSSGSLAGGLNSETLQKAQNAQESQGANTSVNHNNQDSKDKCNCSCNSNKSSNNP